MEYLYTVKEDFSFLASGNVIKHFSGMPCFPVRLNLELFERAYHLLNKDKITVYDPCCGSGFSLTVLGMVCQSKISRIYGSDIDQTCLDGAQCNISMLTEEGLRAATDRLLRDKVTTPERRQQLTESVEKLLPYLVNPRIQAKIFSHDILSAPPELPEKADYIFADIPYGIMTDWQTQGGENSDPVTLFLSHIVPVMAENGILVVCGSKELKIQTEQLRRIEKIRVGKRLIYLLENDRGCTPKTPPWGVCILQTPPDPNLT